DGLLRCRCMAAWNHQQHSRKDDTRHQSARDKWHAWRSLAPATGERMHPIILLGLTDGPATRAPILQATTLHASREFSTSPCRPNRGSVAFILSRHCVQHGLHEANLGKDSFLPASPGYATSAKPALLSRN